MSKRGSASDVVLVGERRVGIYGRIVRWALLCGILAGFAGVVAVVALFASNAKDVPIFEGVASYKPALATRVYSVDGRLIGEFYRERRILVSYDRIPKRLIQAFIAAEDKKFFDHHGIDYLGMTNAVYQKVTGKTRKLRGASTITQQLAKSLLIAAEGFEEATKRTVKRKVREAILAWRLENELNKEEIIWLYLNQVYLGHGAYGVQAAAENYFRKDVFELNLAEMALLAGLPQAPSKFSPVTAPSAARARQQYVLTRMVEDGYIQAAEKAEASALSVEKTVHPRDDAFLDTAPYFTEHVRRYIVDTYGIDALLAGGLVVHTTLDLEREHHAEVAMTDGVREVDKRQGYLGPIAHLDKPTQIEKTLAVVDKEMLKGKGLVEGEPVLVVVTAVDGKRQTAEVKAGTKVTGILPLAGMRWARKLNQNENWEFHKVDNVKDVLHVGDVVLAVPYFSRKAFVAAAMGPGEALELMDDVDVTDASPAFTLDQEPRVQGSVISMNPHTGYVEAMIGGYSYEASEFNRAFQSCRQPGSAFKPIVYSAAIVREGYSPATMVLDTPITLRDADIGKSWKPQNFELEYKGEVTVREAVMNSMNLPALHTTQKVGIKEVNAWAQHLGIMTPLKEELGTGIGSSCVTPWELNGVYTTFARMGLRPDPVFIKRIIDRGGTVIEEHASPNDPWQPHARRIDALYRLLEERPARAMQSTDAFITNYLLQQVAHHGTGARAAKLGHPVAGKTGTTNDAFDTWFVGFTPTLVTTVWIGYDTYEYPLSTGEQGGKTSLPIWLAFMEKALDGKKEEEWEAPAGICHARVDSKNGRRVFDDTPNAFTAPFKCGEEPKSLAATGGISLDEAVRRGGI